MISRELSSIGIGDEEDGGFLVKITKMPRKLRVNQIFQTTISIREEDECRHYGYRIRLPIYITGDTEKRATNIIFVNRTRVTIGDVPFALFLRLVVQLFKNKKGTVPKSRLIKGGYIRPDGEFQAIARLRQAFNTSLDGYKPEELIESCEHKALRLSTHPALISYDRERLLAHRNRKIRRLAQRLP